MMCEPGAAPTAPVLVRTYSEVRTMENPTPTPLDYKVDTETGCWVWQRYCDSNGYGRKWDRRRMEWAHRVYYARFKGPIPDGHEIDHTCENPPCVNPAHLDAVTRVEHCRRTFARLGKDDLHARAALLRQYGLSYDEIAEVLHYQGKGGACSAVKAAISKGLVQAEDLPGSPNLTHEERQEIRELHAMGVPQSVLCRWYQVDSSNISRTISGRRREMSP